MNKTTQTVKDLCEIGILVGLSIVLDTFIKIPISITGGSINFSLVPLFLISLRHGPIKSFIASGLCFGIITCLLDGYGFITYPFDYLLAFAPVCLLGLFGRYINNNFKLGGKYILLTFLVLNALVLSQGIVRFFSASIDSVILYNYSWKASFLYQLTYIPFTTLSNMVIMSLLLPLIIKLNDRYQTSYLAR